MKRIKRSIYNLLCNRLIGSLLTKIYKNGIPDLRWRGLQFQFNPKFVNKTIVASIFWGFYESAEIRYIEKYLHGNLDVLELGGSIGVVSSHILRKLQSGKRLITVEPNPFLIDTINQNLRSNKNENAFFKVINSAISYNTDEIFINISDNNTESSISTKKLDKRTSLNIKQTTLNKIIRDENIQDFVLVCDIEGSEIELLLNEEESLRRCRQLFIELHTVNYEGSIYSVERLKELLQVKHNLRLIDQDGPVCYFERPS